MDTSPRHEPAVERQTGQGPDASVIWLHGLGADGHDFENLVPELHLPPTPGIRFVFPHAPFRPVTINGGYVMRAWYDIAMSERGFEHNVGHIRESVEILKGLIEHEIQRGISAERIVLAGFSQGGAIALHAGLHYSLRLAGILSLSAPVPDVDYLMTEIHPANAAVPIFMAHGTDDSMVPFELALHARGVMQARGLDLSWHSYAMGHSVTPEEIRDISAWLVHVVGNQAG
ncbi:MAG: dienelactone hydrolase family protein [Gammaproteobacteria bacterium]|nr:dienelactone hydrolase family protein [Gammaproteobacteria bacterium]